MEKLTLKPRLRWRKEPREKGLAAITQGPRGYQLWWGDQRIASVSPYCANRRIRTITGYYWSCGAYKELGIEHRNTSDHPAATMDEAKQECEAYVRQCLGLPVRKL